MQNLYYLKKLIKQSSFKIPKIKYSKNTSNNLFINRNLNVDFLFKDSDKDGVMNLFDCYPFDRRRQHVKPNKYMQKRIDKLPIFTTSNISYENPQRKKDIIHLKDSNKRKKNKVYSIFKKYPQLVSEVEEKKPRGVIFTEGIKNKTKDEYMHGFASPTEYGSVSKDTQEGAGVVVVNIADNPYAKKYENKYDLFNTVEDAKTTTHELEHIRQFNVAEKNPQMAAKYSKGDYDQRLAEKLARKKEDELRKSRIDILNKGYENTKDKYGENKKFEETLEEYEKRKKRSIFKNFRSIFIEEEDDDSDAKND